MESDRMGDDPPNGKSTTYQSLSQRSGIHEIAVRDNTEKLIQSPSLFTGPVTRKGYSDGILLLNGHISEVGVVKFAILVPYTHSNHLKVFVCSWHPTSPSILASGYATSLLETHSRSNLNLQLGRKTQPYEYGTYPHRQLLCAFPTS